MKSLTKRTPKRKAPMLQIELRTRKQRRRMSAPRKKTKKRMTKRKRKQATTWQRRSRTALVSKRLSRRKQGAAQSCRRGQSAQAKTLRIFLARQTRLESTNTVDLWRNTE